MSRLRWLYNAFVDLWIRWVNASWTVYSVEVYGEDTTPTHARTIIQCQSWAEALEEATAAIILDDMPTYVVVHEVEARGCNLKWSSTRWDTTNPEHRADLFAAADEARADE